MNPFLRKMAFRVPISLNIIALGYKLFTTKSRTRNTKDEFAFSNRRLWIPKVNAASLDKPEPTPILTLSKDASICHFHEDNLKSILKREDVCDKKVVLVSVAGPFRPFSTLLRVCISYLEHYNEKKWMEEENFKEMNENMAADDHTPKVLMWSEPFIITHPETKEEFAVLLMDTQGLFDTAATTITKDNTSIFAFSTLVSSVQIFNLSRKVIKSSDLQFLKVFSGYASGSMSVDIEKGANCATSEESPSLAVDEMQQRLGILHILVREWEDNSFSGFMPKAIIEKWLMKPNKNEEIRAVCKHVQTWFKEVRCFIMPPNQAIDYQDRLKEYVESLLAPEKLVFKKLNGKEITCEDLFGLFKSYAEAFEDLELPDAVDEMHVSHDTRWLRAHIAGTC